MGLVDTVDVMVVDESYVMMTSYPWPGLGERAKNRANDSLLDSPTTPSSRKAQAKTSV